MFGCSDLSIAPASSAPQSALPLSRSPRRDPAIPTLAPFPPGWVGKYISGYQILVYYKFQQVSPKARNGKAAMPTSSVLRTGNRMLREEMKEAFSCVHKVLENKSESAITHKRNKLVCVWLD